MLISQLGLFAVIWVMLYFIPKIRTANNPLDKWAEDRDISDLFALFLLCIILNIGKVVIVWIAAGALLPYVHMWFPLVRGG